MSKNRIKKPKLINLLKKPNLFQVTSTKTQLRIFALIISENLKLFVFKTECVFVQTAHFLASIKTMTFGWSQR